MNTHELSDITRSIVAEARRLSVMHTDQADAPVNYACIFAQSLDEYEELLAAAHQLGPVAENTSMGPVFRISPVSTDAGQLNLLKIRRPDPKRPERGDADFTVSDYDKFKKTYLGKPGFSIIKREDMEMLELIDPLFNVLAYYSHPPLSEVLKMREEQATS